MESVKWAHPHVRGSTFYTSKGEVQYRNRNATRSFTSTRPALGTFYFPRK